MKPFIVLLLCGWVLGAQVSRAQDDARSFKLDAATVSFAVPNGWQDAQHLFGVPLMLLGPQHKAGGRAVIEVTPTGKRAGGWDPAILAREQSDYTEGRKDWIKRNDGRYLASEDYHTEKWDGASEVHALGVSYKLQDVAYVERSYYVICNEQLYHLKSLFRDANKQSDAPAIHDVLKSFRCGT